MNAVTPTPVSPELSVAFTGSGGSGVVTTGMILLEAAAKAGLYGLMTRSAGPQIRGGESAAMLRLGAEPVRCMGDRFDLLVGLDWLNVSRFIDEIPVDEHSVVVADPASGEIPAPVAQQGVSVRLLPFAERSATVEGGRVNMVALGAAGALCGLPREAVAAAARGTLDTKGPAVTDASLACITLGYQLVDSAHRRTPEPSAAGERWNISGNEACGLGALRGGVRFVAAYPITPASEMLEWLAPRLEQVGGSLLQAEDEIASVNMILGASFGGVPALTATSGPGLSLMAEGMGLAVASETPAVVVDVMRGGPSTGIPTKSEQSDLNIALYGLHGDAPHLVLAPLDIPDCAFTTQWAVRLAEHLQTLAVVLSDQSLGQSRAVTDPPTAFSGSLERRLEHSPAEDYRRYALTRDGVSPMALPGIAGGMFTADGLEHDERGTPSSMASDHVAHLGKRRNKIGSFDYGDHWAEITGDGALCLVTWGSSTGATLEAARRLAARGTDARVVALRLLAPLQRDGLQEALAGATQVWVIEQNDDGQLFRYLRAEAALPPFALSLARPGPLPLRPGDICATITNTS